MKSIHVIAIIAISFVAGMFGGAFSERVFANPNADGKIPEQILARAFHLVDEKNQTRASMAFSADGQPVVCVADQEGKPRGYLGCAPSGPMLALIDKAGKMMVTLEADDDGSSSIGLMKTNGKPNLILVNNPSRGPALVFNDENDVAKLVVAVDHGKPSVTLTQGGKKPAISMFYNPKQGPMLGVWNSRNEAKAGFGLMHDRPLLFAYNPDDTGLLFNTQRDGRPALGLLSDGRVVWSATGAAPQMPAMDGILDQILR